MLQNVYKIPIQKNGWWLTFVHTEYSLNYSKVDKNKYHEKANENSRSMFLSLWQSNFEIGWKSQGVIIFDESKVFFKPIFNWIRIIHNGNGTVKGPKNPVNLT